MYADRVFYVIMGLIVVMAVSRFIKGRSFRGMIYGAPIEGKIAEIELGRRAMATTTLRVYRLEVDAGPDIADLALEIASRTVVGFNMRGVTLTRSQAASLADALYEGAGKRPADGVRAG